MCPSSQYSASRLLKEYASTAQTITKNAMIIILPLPPAFVPCKRRTFENISVVVRALKLASNTLNRILTGSPVALGIKVLVFVVLALSYLRIEMESNQQPLLCRMGCGYFGNAATEGMCSKCFRDNQRRKSQQGQQQQKQPSPIPPNDRLAVADCESLTL